MSGLYVPPTVAYELAQRTLSFREDVAQSIRFDDGDPILREFTQRLQAIDSRLIMVRARERVVPGVPMRPGYYHVLQDCGVSVPLSITVIEGEHGEFVYPTSRVFDKLAAGDMRQDRNLERWMRAKKAEYEANEREQRDNHDERVEHRTDLVNAYTRTSVSTTDARPWTQNNQPAARREAGERQHVKAVE
jgi:hypothetical protein